MSDSLLKTKQQNILAKLTNENSLLFPRDHKLPAQIFYQNSLGQ